jgi:hypothetical protein
MRPTRVRGGSWSSDERMVATTINPGADKSLVVRVRVVGCLVAGIVLDYIKSLQSQLGGDDDVPMEQEERAAPSATSNEPPFPAVYASGEDFEKAGDLKQEAADLASSGNWEGGEL